MTLVEKIAALHRALRDAGVPHAFGGALALAWCTAQARGTIDVDLNLFVSPWSAADVLPLLPGITWSEADLATIDRDGQVRLWWDRTPVDLFFDTTDFHRAVATRVRTETFAGEEVPFLGCDDLAVFKAFFDRTKDWADLEAMLEVCTLDVDVVLGTLVRLLGAGDHRVDRLRSLVVG